MLFYAIMTNVVAWLYRRRPSARNRKPVNNQRDKIPNPGDVLSFCCCLCDDDQPSHSNNRSSNASSFKNRYFRLACLVIFIIVIAVLASITVSLQRKVESLDGNCKFYELYFSLYTFT